ncbi:MAG: deoxyhypusine synthase family protein [Acidobacteria bacterium]|nr:deoxyhypusine synthase family protein [Acidobacteriota bacterium]
MHVSDFIREHYRHFNAAALRDAAVGYADHLKSGGKMMVAMAGAMSTAELGRSLAEMIRQDKVHAISCTGANLEEDLFNLVAHEEYRSIPHWRNLTREKEKELEHQGLNRVTDTCIPEVKAFRAIEKPILELWQRADRSGQRYFPHEFMFQLLREGTLRHSFQIDPKHSWLVAACEKNLPMFVPGWEDSTLGNICVSHVLNGDLSGFSFVRTGLEAMASLADYYLRTTLGQGMEPPAQRPPSKAANEADPVRALPPKEARSFLGLFQIGGGIAGDFPICVVPMIHQDLRRPCPYWAYFCQISDSTASYGSYSGAFPTEKITWGKLDVDTPMFLIESDATIVAPLVFAYLLGW